MARTTTLVIRIIAPTQKLVRDMGRAKKTVKGTKMGLLAAGAAAATFAAGVTATARAVDVMSRNVRRSVKDLDSMAKSARRLGIPVEQLAGLRQAAIGASVDVRTMEMGFQRMTRRVSEAAVGLGEAQGALKELGLDAQALNRLSPDQQFREITKAMAGVQNQTDRVRLAFKLFDSEGVRLLDIMAQGVEGLDRFQAEARQLGQVFTQGELANIERVETNFGKLTQAAEGFWKTLTVELAPGIELVQIGLLALAKQGIAFIRIVPSIASGIASGVALMISRIKAMEAAWFDALAAGTDFVSRQLQNLRTWANTTNTILRAMGVDIGIPTMAISTLTDAIETLDSATTTFEADARMAENQGKRWANSVQFLKEMFEDWTAAMERGNQVLAQTPPLVKAVEEKNADLQAQLRATEGAAGRFTNKLADGIGELLVEGESLTDLLKDIEKQLAKMAIQGLFGGLLSVATGGAGGFLGGFIGKLFAQGGVLPAAQGMVLDGPTLFQGNPPVLAGEAGSEAVLPLTRMAGGNLGVEANLNMNVNGVTDFNGFRENELMIFRRFMDFLRRDFSA